MSELTVGTISGLAANDYVVDVAAGSLLTQPGMVLQVVSTTKTDTFTTTSTTYTDITGLTASITPRSTSSKILVVYSVFVGEDTASFPNMRLLRDSTAIAIGNTGAGGQDSVTLSHWSGGQTNYNSVLGGNYLDSPSTTSSIVYKFQIHSVPSGTQYINRNSRDVTGDPRGISTITLMEIAG